MAVLSAVLATPFAASPAVAAPTRHQLAYVTNSNSGSLSTIDTTTNEVTTTLPVGSNPRRVATTKIGALATPMIVTTATPTAVPGDPISDTAALVGGVNPAGVITFRVFGPGDTTCTGFVFFTSVKLVTGNGTYTSDPYFTMLFFTGTFRWIAAYSGDLDNTAVSTACNDPGESSVVAMATPTMTTTATPTAVPGGPISDTAALVGGVNPAGVITFRVFGPGDTTCTGAPVFTSGKTVTGNGGYTSDPFTPPAPGIYRWTAFYSGDFFRNRPTSTACNDPAESSVVAFATPTIMTTATPKAVPGGQISDTATLAGGVNPTGTITFRAFPPGDTTCTAELFFTSVVTVNGNGTYTSDPFSTPSFLSGTYRWTAAYSGDVGNLPVSTACNDPGESSVVAATPPTITTAFGAATIPLNQTTSLGFTLTNPNSGTSLTGLGFTDNLPAGLVVATPNGLTGSCVGGTITATAGSGSISLSGATLPAGGDCTFSVNLKATTTGTKVNTTSIVTSTQSDPGGPATATITVTADTPTTAMGPLPVTGSQSQTHATVALIMIGLGAALLTISHRLAPRRRKTT